MRIERFSRRGYCGFSSRSCVRPNYGEMKKSANTSSGLGVGRKPSGSSGYTWRDVTIYILTGILCVQALAILVWMPRCWRLRFFGNPEDSPYTITEIMIGGKLSARNIKNLLTGEMATIVVDYGGRVEALQLMSQSQGKVRDVLLTHHDNASAIMENKYWRGMLLVPWANRIAYGKYEFFGKQYTLDINENETYVNALHGLLANKTMTVKGSEIQDSFASLTLSLDYTGTDPGYPFLMKIDITYTLSGEGFSIAFSITNTMPNSPLPLYVGWHPYFACTAYKAVVTLDPCTKWNHVTMDSNFDPTGATQLNTTFNGSTPIGGSSYLPTFYDDEFKATESAGVCHDIKTRLYDPDSGQTVVLWQAPNFRFIHIFTGSMSRFGEDAVAIEPMSGMADAYNNHDHLSTLSGGENWTGEFGVYVE